MNGNSSIRDKGKEKVPEQESWVSASKTNKRRGHLQVGASHGKQDSLSNTEASSSKVAAISSNSSIQAKDRSTKKLTQQNSWIKAVKVKKEKKSWQSQCMASNSEASSSKVITVFSENKDSPNQPISHDLPVELFMHVFSFLSLRNLPNLRRISRQVKELAEDAMISRAEQYGIRHFDIKESGRTFISYQRDRFGLAREYLKSLFKKTALIPQGLLVKHENAKDQQVNGKKDHKGKGKIERKAKEFDLEATFLKIRHHGSVQEVLSILHALLASGSDEQSRAFIAFLSERVLSKQFGDLCDSHLKEISENPNELDNYLTTIRKSFGFAAKFNYTEIMEFLFLKLNNPKPKIIKQALKAALYNGSLEAFTFLLPKVNLDAKLLNRALRFLLHRSSDRHDWVKLLIDHGPKGCLDDSTGDNSIFNLCLWQLSRKWRPVVKHTLELLLTEKPVLANAQVNGITPLLYACYSDKEMLPTIQFLLESQANPNSAESSNGLTPLHCVVTGEDQVLEKFKLLMDKGADLHAKDKRNLTPLEHIIRLEIMDIIHFLIERGEDFTPVIHDIVLWRQNELLELILEKGKVDINKLNDYGFSPLGLAQFAKSNVNLPFSVCEDYERISDLLEKNGAIKKMPSKKELRKFDSVKVDEFITTSSKGLACLRRINLKTQSFNKIYELNW